MRFGFVCLFPELIRPAMESGVVGRACESGLLSATYATPRDFADGVHQAVDNDPYGGGPGMVMQAPQIAAALESLEMGGGPVVLCDASAPLFRQQDAESLAGESSVRFICGRYEGVDERVRQKLATHAFSIGDFVLSGGELPAAVMADSIARLVPGVLGDAQSHEDDSYSTGLLGHPLYTRPAVWEGLAVPDVLSSGDHPKISTWRRKEALRRTRQWRPDLLARAELEPEDLKMLAEAHEEAGP